MKRILGAALLYPLAFSLGCSTTGGGSAPDPNSGNGGGNNGGTGSTGAGNNGGAGFHTQTTGGNVSTSSSAPDIDSGCGHDTTKYIEFLKRFNDKYSVQVARYRKERPAAMSESVGAD